MENEDRYNPYDIVLETPSKLHLHLNRFHRFVTFWLTVLLPLFIATMIGISVYFMFQEGETSKALLLLLVLVAPAMLMFATSWPIVIMERGKVEVHVKKFFRIKTYTYTVTNHCKLEVQWKRAYKTAAWEFVLTDETGKRTILFAIPDAPFKRRLAEKENLLEALEKYSRPSEKQFY